MMVKFGRFVVKATPSKGFLISFTVIDECGKVYGTYANSKFAATLAKCLHEGEIKKIDKEMDDLLAK